MEQRPPPWCTTSCLWIRRRCCRRRSHCTTWWLSARSSRLSRLVCRALCPILHHQQHRPSMRRHSHRSLSHSTTCPPCRLQCPTSTRKAMVCMYLCATACLTRPARNGALATIVVIIGVAVLAVLVVCLTLFFRFVVHMAIPLYMVPDLGRPRQARSR